MQPTPNRYKDLAKEATIKQILLMLKEQGITTEQLFSALRRDITDSSTTIQKLQEHRRHRELPVEMVDVELEGEVVKTPALNRRRIRKAERTEGAE